MRHLYGPAVLALVCAAAWPTGASADTGTVLSANAPGLSFSVDTRWVPSAAYRPVKITITPNLPVTADRTISVEFWRSVSGYRDYCLQVVQDVEIPAGSGPVEATVAIPRLIGWANYRFTFVENGKEIAAVVGNEPPGQEFGPESTPTLLIIQKRPPEANTRILAEALLEELRKEYGGRGWGPGPTQTSAQAQPWEPLGTAVTRSADELPARWIDYSSCDIVGLSLDELRGLSEARPAAFRAVLDWAWAGGTLWVWGAEDDWRRLPELESLVGLAPKGATRSTGPARGWSEPDSRLYARPLGRPDLTDGASNIAVAVGRRSFVATPAIRAKPEAAIPDPKAPPPPAKAPFVWREYGLGLIVAMPADPWPGDKHFWRWLFNTMGPDRYLWCHRHGLSMIRENPEFWNFSVPGVGLPPVGAFRVLLTLFVLAIGPANYWLLRRWRKLHLLVITIPAGAAAVTLALFAYAVIADGLRTRVRVRSVTLLDQQRGRAACWARLSYYCGLTPSGGLRFPADVAVLPLEPSPGDARSRRQDMVWEEDQGLTGGWVTARTPVQFVTVRSRGSSAGLDIRTTLTPDPSPGTGEGSSALEITNRLGVPIEYLAVSDRDGKYYHVRDVPAEGHVRAEPAALADVAAELSRAHANSRLAYPTGTDPRRMVRGRYGSRRYVFGGGPDVLGDPTQSTGRLEEALTAHLTARGWSAAPGHYVALTHGSPEVELGTPSAREESSFHVILGSW